VEPLDERLVEDLIIRRVRPELHLATYELGVGEAISLILCSRVCPAQMCRVSGSAA
jgi:hypothetical protein